MIASLKPNKEDPCSRLNKDQTSGVRWKVHLDAGLGFCSTILKA